MDKHTKGRVFFKWALYALATASSAAALHWAIGLALIVITWIVVKKANPEGGEYRFSISSNVMTSYNLWITNLVAAIFLITVLLSPYFSRPLLCVALPLALLFILLFYDFDLNTFGGQVYGWLTFVCQAFLAFSLRAEYFSISQPLGFIEICLWLPALVFMQETCNRIHASLPHSPYPTSLARPSAPTVIAKTPPPAKPATVVLNPVSNAVLQTVEQAEDQRMNQLLKDMIQRAFFDPP